MAGIENGYTVKSAISSRFRTTERTRASSTLRVYFRFGRVNDKRTGQRHEGGGVGPLAKESCEGMLRTEERSPGPFRYVHASAPRGARARRSDARSQEQRHARQGVMRSRCADRDALDWESLWG